MTNYAQICLIFTNCGRIYGQKWPDLWPNEIVGMAMAMVAIPDFTSMDVTENAKQRQKHKNQKYPNQEHHPPYQPQCHPHIIPSNISSQNHI